MCDLQQGGGTADKPSLPALVINVCEEVETMLTNNSSNPMPLVALGLENKARFDRIAASPTPRAIVIHARWMEHDRGCYL